MKTDQDPKLDLERRVAELERKVADLMRKVANGYLTGS